MSLFSSLYTGASGLIAQSKSTAMISTNIANVNTVGYKKSEAVFSDIVTDLNNRNAYTSGGVSASRIQRIDQQGNIQQTNIGTDTAINGNGFFVVRTQPDVELDVFYTRNGTFNEDRDGILRNSAGFALYALPLDENGNIPVGNITTATLVPAEVDIFDNAFQTTTSMSQTTHLNANETAINLHRLGAGAEISNQPAQFVRNVQIVDSAGQTRDVTVEFRRTAGPGAHFSSTSNQSLSGITSLTDPSVFPGINAGDSFTITGGGTTQSYIIGANGGPGDVRIDTVGDLLNDLNTNFGGGTALQASIDETGQLLVRSTDLNGAITLNETGGNPLTAGGSLSLLQQPGNPALAYSPDTPNASTNGIDNPNQSDFPAFDNLVNPNVSNWWQMRVLIPDDPSNPTGQPQEISKGFVNFNGDGSLNAALDADGNAIVTLNNLDFDSADGTDDIASIAFDISGLAQFSGNYSVIDFSQNGIETGTRTGVEINDGTISAVFSNGITRPLYEIPLMTFVNANGLDDVSGTVFSETADSGPGTLNTVGTGGAGLIHSSHVEGSNVDLADEFARLIVSQRAYGASSQVIRTVDEMTQRAGELNR